MPHRLGVRRRLPLDVEVGAAQVGRIHAQQRRAPTEDVLDHQHPLRTAEAAEGRLRGLVGVRHPAVHAHVRDPVGVVDVAQRPGEHRLAQVEAPAAVGGQRRRQADESAVVVEPDLPRGVEAVPLAGHGEVVGAVEAHPDRPSGEHRPECGNRREAVRLHLLAAEAAAHPQALRGDVVALHAEHVRHDLLGLGRVLGAALHEHLAALVDQGQRGVGLEVEVLLPGHLGDALEDVGRGGQRGVDLPALDHRVGSLEALGLDRLGQRDHRRQRLVVDDDGLGTEPGGLEGLPQHPAHGVPDEHHDLGEERLVVLDAGVVDPRHVLGGEHADHPRRRRAPGRCRAG